MLRLSLVLCVQPPQAKGAAANPGGILCWSALRHPNWRRQRSSSDLLVTRRRPGAVTARRGPPPGSSSPEADYDEPVHAPDSVWYCTAMSPRSRSTGLPLGLLHCNSREFTCTAADPFGSTH
jgi:hypothetical protein